MRNKSVLAAQTCSAPSQAGHACTFTARLNSDALAFDLSGQDFRHAEEPIYLMSIRAEAQWRREITHCPARRKARALRERPRQTPRAIGPILRGSRRFQFPLPEIK